MSEISVNLFFGRVRATHLEAEEVQYETERRQSHASTDHPVVNETARDILQRWIDRDVAEERVPMAWTIEYDSDGATQDIEWCHQNVMAMSSQVSTVIRDRDYETASVLQSRMIHYFWRLRRSDEVEVSAHVNINRISAKLTVRTLLSVLQPMMEQCEKEFADQMAQVNASRIEPLGTPAPNHTLNSTGRDRYGQMETPQRGSQEQTPDESEPLTEIKKLEKWYEPAYREVRAWLTNGMATINGMRRADAIIEVALIHWHQIHETADESDYEIQGRLAVLMKRLREQRAWIRAETKVREETINKGATNRVAQSTIYHDSMQAYNTRIEPLNLDDSVTSHIPVPPPKPPLDAARELKSQTRNGVSFEGVNDTFAKAKPSATVVDGEKDRTRVWPPSGLGAEHEQSFYHPAVINRSALESVVRPRPEPSHNNSSTNGMAYQSQMVLTKWLGARKYDGLLGINNNKSISTDEFIGCLQAYQHSTGFNDITILNSIAHCFSGIAFHWWRTMSPTVLSIAELESLLKNRFDKKRTGQDNQMMEFYSRKQGPEEYLADYIDDMCSKAFSLHPRLEETRIIQIIVDNSNRQCKGQLATRCYGSIIMLRQHADYLGASGLVSIPNAVRKSSFRKPTFQIKSVHAIQSESNEGEEYESENEFEDDVSAEGEASRERELRVEAVTKNGKSWQVEKFRRSKETRRSISPPRVKPSHVTEREPPGFVMTAAELMEIRCYGCQAPGFIQRNCPTCNPSMSGEFGCFGCGAPGVMRRNCVKCTALVSKNANTRL